MNVGRTPVLVSVVQMRPNVGEAEENMRRAEEHLRAAASSGTALVVLPELFDTGYVLDDRLADLATTRGGPRVERLRSLAGELDLTIATAMALRDEHGNLFDVGVVATPDGELHTVNKRYLWGDEDQVFTRGRVADGGLVVTTPIGAIGMVVCYEIGFPEVCRELVLGGAELLVVPSAFGRPRLHAWQLLTRTRALENGAFLLAANATGSNGKAEFAAHSTIVNPHGERLGQLHVGDGLLTTEIDLAEIDGARVAIPYLADLRRHSENVAEEKG